MTYWMNEITGVLLDEAGLRELHERARRLYAVNGHIFEDEREALSALGAVPLGGQPAASASMARRDGTNR